MKDKMKSTELIGRKVTLVVDGTPCRCLAQGYLPLTATVSGTIERMEMMPAGAVGYLKADDGRKICFDADSDIKRGVLTIEVPYDA